MRLEPSCKSFKLRQRGLITDDTIGLGILRRDQRVLRVDHIENGALAVLVAQIGEAQALASVSDAGVERGELPVGDIRLVVKLSQIGEQPALGCVRVAFAAARESGPL